MTLLAPAPIDDSHITDGFDCGNATLNDWLKRRARANQASGASRTFVVADDARVVGYYALSSASIACNEATGRMRRNMPDPIPVVALGRLAIDRSYQGRGLGRDLVQDAGRRVAAAADLIGIRGMIVHAIDEKARDFYTARGFLQSPLHDLTLMISLSDLKASLLPPEQGDA